MKKKEKPVRVKKLISSMITVLDAVGIPLDDCTEHMKMRIAEATLAVADIRNTFSEAKSSDDGHFLTTKDIIEFENKHLSERYSRGSYDDIRREHLARQVAADIIINSSDIDSQSTNDPTRGYAISTTFAKLLRSYKTSDWEGALADFKREHEELKEILAHKRDLERIPVILPSGIEISLSAGKHNELQRDIIYKFLRYFGMGAEVLYLGDTTDKDAHLNAEKLKSLNFFELKHEELPDIVAYSESHNILFLIEAVHSSGEMKELRVMKLKNKLQACTATIVIVTAFENKKTFRTCAANIAWDTEVWIADNPDHMIHFNGYKFLEIHKNA